ncbi:MAG: amidohydrolase family protein [Clostridia bacterium]|nr:amidohydrolase family protein [Clostridia bacterium]
MYIDFHTHIFPEKIAAATVAHLGELCEIAPSTDGTASGLRQSMDRAGIALSVVLPVVTKPSQFASINRFAAAVNAENDRLISFGGIHPDNDAIEDKLDEIVSLGLKGIKLHPDYQGVFIDDERYLRILQGAVDRNLLVSIHAGIDKGLPDTVHCPPARTRKALDALTLPSEPRIILAHGGGWGCWDEVETYLVGQPVYFDLGVTVEYIEEAQLLRLIRSHSAERILFATDAPWSDQANIVRRFEALPLTDAERHAIAYGNAAALLGY